LFSMYLRFYIPNNILYIYIYIYIYILCTYIHAKLSLIILIILEACIYDEGFRSGWSFCRDGVMYGGGFVQGVCLEGCLSRIQDIQVLVPFRTLITPPPAAVIYRVWTRHASLEFTGSPDNAVKRIDRLRCSFWVSRDAHIIAS
jgi:hypothetical protein